MDRLQKKLSLGCDSLAENSDRCQAGLQKMASRLIQDCVYTGNLSVLQVLANEGVVVIWSRYHSAFDPRIPPLLLRQLLANSNAFLREVAEFATGHPEKNVPRLPESWENALFANSDIAVYGRSLAFACAATPNGYRRFKFLKQLPGA